MAGWICCIYLQDELGVQAAHAAQVSGGEEQPARRRTWVTLDVHRNPIMLLLL